jgi:hypothetical protein
MSFPDILSCDISAAMIAFVAVIFTLVAKIFGIPLTLRRTAHKTSA